MLEILYLFFNLFKKNIPIIPNQHLKAIFYYKKRRKIMNLSTAVCLSVLDINFPLEDSVIKGEYFGISVNIIKNSEIIQTRTFWDNGVIENFTVSFVCNLARLAYNDSRKFDNDFDIQVRFFLDEFSKDFGKYESFGFLGNKNGIYERVSFVNMENIEGSTIFVFPTKDLFFNVKSVLYSSKFYTDWQKILYDNFRNSDDIFILNSLYIEQIVDSTFKNHCIDIINKTYIMDKSYIQLSLKIYSVSLQKNYIEYCKNNNLEFSLLLLGVKSKKIKYYTNKIFSSKCFEDLFDKFNVEEIASVIIFCIKDKSHGKKMVKISEHLSKLLILGPSTRNDGNNLDKSISNSKLSPNLNENLSLSKFSISILSKVFCLLCILSKYGKSNNFIWECFLVLFRRISSNGMITNERNEEDISSTMIVLESLAIYLRIQ